MVGWPIQGSAIVLASVTGWDAFFQVMEYALNWTTANMELGPQQLDAGAWEEAQFNTLTIIPEIYLQYFCFSSQVIRTFLTLYFLQVKLRATVHNW